jgi:hypothetical protein
MGTDREQAMTRSPELATLIVTLGGAILGRALVGRAVLGGMIRRDRSGISAGADPRD